MEIMIYVNRKKIDRDFLAAANEYIKRTSPYCRMQIKPSPHHNKQITEKSNKTMTYAVVPGIDTIPSPALADLIQELNVHGISSIEYIICRDESDYRQLSAVYEAAHRTTLPCLCLSSFSLSEELAAVVLSEQLYRAYTILNNITYHK